MTDDKSYEIGTVLWLLALNKKVVPGLVVGKETKEMRDRKEVRHIIELAGAKERTLVLEESLEKGLVISSFKSLEDAKASLQKSANQIIDRLIADAQEKAAQFGDQVTASVETDVPDAATSSSDNLPRVTLPDGTVARVHLPENFR